LEAGGGQIREIRSYNPGEGYFLHPPGGMPVSGTGARTGKPLVLAHTDTVVGVARTVCPESV
jgi:hypothetical protein